MKPRSKKKGILKKAIAFLMATVITATSLPLPVKAAQVEDKQALNPTGVEFSIAWKGTDSPSLRWDESEDVDRAVTMTASYSCKKVRPEGYQPGDLIITLKGIGAANRSGNMESLVGADKAGSAVKNRDWTYTWDRVKDTYTLTNNRYIEGGSVFTGYFELVWKFRSRSTKHDFSQDVNASMYLPYGDGTATLNSNTLSFGTTMEKDTYTVQVQASKLESAEGFTSKLPAGTTEDDYYFVKYDMTGQWTDNARGLKSGEFIDITLEDDAVFLHSNKNGNLSGDGSNTYRFPVSYGYNGLNNTYNPFYLYAAYPKAAYGSTTTATVTAAVKGTFHEEETESLLAQDEETINVSEFDFIDDPGVIYDLSKKGYGHYTGTMDDGCYNEGFLNGGALSKNETASYTLHTVIRSPETALGAGQEWNLEYVDDFLYIMRNDGTYRKLGMEEYEFTSVTIPSATSLTNMNNLPIVSGAYEYIVYASVQDGYNSRKEVARGVLDGKSHTVTLPKGTNLYSVAIKGLKEGIKDFPIQCSVKFHTLDKENDLARKDNLETGQLVNTCFIRIYDNANNLYNDWPTDDHYTDKAMAADDMRTYGMYLDREKATLHVHQRYSDFRNSVTLNAFEEVKYGFTTTASNTTSFDYLSGDKVGKVSSYILFPAGLAFMPEVTYPEAIWEYVDLSGLGVTDEYLADHCTIEFTRNYRESGRSFIAFHFDFSDKPLTPNASLRTGVKTFLSGDDFLRYGNSYTIQGISMLDDNLAVINPAFHQRDNGSWSSICTDIDNDGDTQELVSVRSDSSSIIYAASSQLALNKWVETTYTNGLFVQDIELDEKGQATGESAPYEELSGQYQYKLKLKNGNNTTTGLVITDILEDGPNGEWKGELLSVDTSQAQKLGFNPVVRYAKTTSPAESDWTTDITGAKAVQIDFSSGELGKGEELYVILNMKAPAGLEHVGKLAENRYSATFTMRDATTGEETKADGLESNYVQVKLSKPRYNLILDKTDATSGAVLAGAVFQLKQGDTVAAEGATNLKGRLIFKDIEEGLYTLHEVTPPTGYETMQDVTLNITGDGDHRVLYHRAEDVRKKGSVVLTKHSDLDYGLTVPDAVYTLYDAADDSIIKDDLVTDEAGQIHVEGLEWGSYYFKEKESPEGYELSEEKIQFTISRQNVSTQVKVSARDPQLPASIKLLKYEELEDGTQTTTPLQGAFFTLYRDRGEDTDLEEIGTYGTDADGELNITDLAYGNYILRELKAPNGYGLTEDIPVTLDAAHREVTVTAYDKRKEGSLLIEKTDKEGHALEGAEFTLYDADKNVYAKETTDSTGVIKLTGLPWGTYTLKETKAPDGYLLDKTEHAITIGPDSLSVRIAVVNERTLGSVRLVKMDETQTHRLAGAEYSLYTDDGTRIKSGLTTDDQGEIFVDSLDWGTYYFKEDKAPEGYGLSGELVRFSINAENCTEILELVATDPVQTARVRLNKQILAADLHPDHGIPTFLFTVRGTDVNGEEHTWNRVVSFAEGSYGAADADGYVSASADFTEIPAGTYTAFESTVSRYDFSSIEDVTANGTIKGQTVEFDMNGYDYGEATFRNVKKEWQDYSDSGSIANMIKASRKLAGLKVVYEGPATLDSGTELTQFLTVSALYDDGSVKELTTDEYAISDLVAPYQPGDYTVTVSYTESGVTRRGTFNFHINYNETMHPEVVKMTLASADGSSLAFAPGGAIDKSRLVVEVTYNTGETKVLDAASYNLNYTVAPADEGTYSLQAEFTEWGVTYQSSELLFKVRTLHLNDYSWSQIQQIIASGQAPVTFAECFENGCCKEILLSAGVASEDYIMQPSGENIAEQKIYVNILGFDHEQPADGDTFRPNATFGMAAAKMDGDNYIANQTEWLKSASGLTEESVSGSDYGIHVARYLKDVYDQCLPNELKKFIIPVSKKTIHRGTSDVMLFLFAEVELFGQWYENADGSISEQGQNRGDALNQYGWLKSSEGEGSQYEYYSVVNDVTNLTNLRYRLDRRNNWWMRSAYTGGESSLFVYKRGIANTELGSVWYTSSISFGFCIG